MSSLTCCLLQWPNENRIDRSSISNFRVEFKIENKLKRNKSQRKMFNILGDERYTLTFFLIKNCKFSYTLSSLKLLFLEEDLQKCRSLSNNRNCNYYQSKRSRNYYKFAVISVYYRSNAREAIM